MLSSILQRNTEVQKTLTRVCICGTVLIVAVLVSLPDQRPKFITFQFQITQLLNTTEVISSHIIVQIECTFSCVIFKSLPVLHITFKCYCTSLHIPGKIKQFNSSLDEMQQLDEASLGEVEKLLACVANGQGGTPTGQQLGTLWRLLNWPQGKSIKAPSRSARLDLTKTSYCMELKCTIVLYHETV